VPVGCVFCRGAVGREECLGSEWEELKERGDTCAVEGEAVVE